LVPYGFPICANSSVRASYSAYTQKRSPKSGTWKTIGSLSSAKKPAPYTTSWFGHATKD